MVKKTIKRLLLSVGFDVRKVSPGKHARDSLCGLLSQARNIGLRPATIIDVGAAYGSFTAQCHTIFPDAQYILIEPVKEYKYFLEKTCKSISKVKYIEAAATKASGEITLNVHPDLAGSSLYLEEEDSNVNGVPRSVCAITLDNLNDEDKFATPILLKIDVQGAELDVLAGAVETLKHAEYVLLEVSLFQFFKNGPLFYDIITYMKSRGFVTYDLSGIQYRPLDNAVSQVDIAFVKEDGMFRKFHNYATPKQREHQNNKYNKHMKKIMKQYNSQ